MPQDEVYTISVDEVPRTLDEVLEGRSRARGRGGNQGSDSHIRYAQPPAQGMQAFNAATLSLFFWGMGQVYNRQGKLGALLLLTQAFAAAAHWALYTTWSDLKEVADLFGVTEWQLFTGVAAMDFVLVLVMMSGIWQAYRHAEREGGEFEGCANPIASGLASSLVPGWGQLVNGQLGKALFFLFFLLCGVYVVMLVMFTPFLRLLPQADPGGLLADRMNVAAIAILGLAGLMWVLSIYDAVLVAGFRRRMS